MTQPAHDHQLLADMPAMIGPYRPISPIGQGGMAKVYRAVHPRRQAVSVAIKQILPDHAVHPQFRAAFARELETTAAFRHLNIVRMHEHGVASDGTPYMVMELVEGLDLRTFQKAHPGRQLPAAWVTLIALDLAHALEYVHDTRRAGGAAVLHRDISPQNVLLTPQGDAKLTDFGIAKAVDEQGEATATVAVSGKLMYMSPEQAMGEDLDARADLYALGLVLFELIAGEPAFPGSGPTKLFARVRAAERTALAALAPAETPAALVDIVEGLLRPDREARTPDASTLIRQLTPLAPAFLDRLDLARAVAEYRNRDTTTILPTSASLPRPLPAQQPNVTIEVQQGDILTAAPPRGRVPEPQPEIATDAPTRPRVLEPSPAPATSILPKPRPAVSRRARLASAAAVVLLAAGGGGAYVATQHAPAELPGHLAGPAVNAADGVAPAASQAAPVATAQAAPTPTAPVVTSATAPTPPPEPPPAAALAETPPSPTPGSELPSPPAASPQEPTTTPATAERSRSSAPATPGTVRVVVLPWGEVWVDGAAQGQAPQTLTLRPGRHTIAVGQGGPSERRAVTVRAGEEQTVRFDLRE